MWRRKLARAWREAGRMPERVLQCRVQSTHSRTERVNTRLAGSYKWFSREGPGCGALNWAMKQGHVANRTGK